jgi:hypothetical protein
MPPKWLTTFLTGRDESFTSGSGLDTALIELGAVQNAVSMSQASRSSDTTDYAGALPSGAVPLSATLRPRMPTVTKGNGPSLQIRQLWEGTVTELRDDGFVATLSDRTKPSNPDEQAVFEFEYVEVSDDDRHLISPGSVFYWTIGTERTPAGQVKNVSSVEFRRSPAWTRGALANASTRASHLKGWFQSKDERLNPAEG